MRLFRRSAQATTEWIFAEEILSAVSRSECERLADLARAAQVLELGAYYGRSTVAMASVADVVHSVDPHEGGPPESPDTLGPFLDNLRAHGVRDRVLVHVGPSTRVVPLLKPDSFDGVFVDAMHQRPEVDVDLVLSTRVVRPGGWLALHDYGRDGVQVGDVWHPFGVTEAVDEFVALAGCTAPEVIDSLAVLRVPTDEDGLAGWRAGLERFADRVAT